MAVHTVGVDAADDSVDHGRRRSLVVIGAVDLFLQRHRSRIFHFHPAWSFTRCTQHQQIHQQCRIDYGNVLLANAPKICRTEKLQRVLNAAARVITGTRKFDSGLRHILHHDFRWLDVPQRVIFKLCMTACLHG